MIESPAPEIATAARINPYDAIVNTAMSKDARITCFLPTRGTHTSFHYNHLGEYYQRVQVKEIPKKGQKESTDTTPLPLYLREHSTELVKLVIEKQLDGLSLDEKNRILEARKDELKDLGFNDVRFDKTKGFMFTYPAQRENPHITANRIKIAEEDINRFAFVLSAISQDLDPVCVVRDTAHKGADFRTQKGAETIKAIVTRFENLTLANNKALAPDELIQGIRQSVGYAEYEWVEFTKQGMREKLNQELLLTQLSSLKLTERINPAPKFGEFTIAEGITTLAGDRSFIGEYAILPEAKLPTTKGEKVAKVESVVLLDWLAARYADIFISPKFLVEEQKMMMEAEALRQKSGELFDASSKSELLKRHLELEAQVRENRQVMRLVMLEKLGFNLEKEYAGNQAMLDYVKGLKYRLEPGPVEGQINIFLSDRYEAYSRDVNKRWDEIMGRNLKINDIQPTLLTDVISQLRRKKLSPEQEKNLAKLLDKPKAREKIGEIFSDLGVKGPQLEIAERLFNKIQWNHMREMTAEERLKKGFQDWTTTRTDADGKPVDNGIFARVGLHLNDPKENSLKTVEEHLAKGYKNLLDNYAERKIEDPARQEQMREIVKPAVTTTYPDGTTDEEGRPKTYPKESSNGIGDNITRRKIQPGETQPVITVEETDQGLRYVKTGAEWTPLPPGGISLSRAEQEEFRQAFGQQASPAEVLQKLEQLSQPAGPTQLPEKTAGSPTKPVVEAKPQQATSTGVDILRDEESPLPPEKEPELPVDLEGAPKVGDLSFDEYQTKIAQEKAAAEKPVSPLEPEPLQPLAQPVQPVAPTPTAAAVQPLPQSTSVVEAAAAVAPTFSETFNPAEIARLPVNLIDVSVSAETDPVAAVEAVQKAFLSNYGLELDEVIMLPPNKVEEHLRQKMIPDDLQKYFELVKLKIGKTLSQNTQPTKPAKPQQ